MTVGFRRIIIAFQGVYYTATGLWPLLHLKSFEAVTGEKTDDWLVYMVGALALVIGATLLVGARRWAVSMETIVLAVLSALAFGAVDTIFVLNETISRVYLADAVVQVVIVIALITGARFRRAR